MKFNHWLWAGVLLLSARALSSMIPSSRTLPFLPPHTADRDRGHIKLTSASPCRLARPAVVTLYAGLEFGSGSIVRSDGLVLTNEHVIRDANNGQVRARTWGGRLFTGQVLATDRVNDLALVQLNTTETLPVVHLAKLDDVQGGQDVCAIGSPFARTGIITIGKLNGTRENGDLQSTILLHPGNSGGPLLNSQGEMIGVNKAVWLSENGENAGIGFATTATIAQRFIDQSRPQASLIKSSPDLPNIEPAPQGTMNIDASPDVPTNNGAPAPAPAGSRLGAVVDDRSLVVQFVEPNSAAENAGLTAGDHLLSVNGQPLKHLEDLQTFLEHRPQSAVFTISRNQQPQDVRVEF